MQSSTFGQLLMWVHDRLAQVETNMAYDPQFNPSQSISQARSSISALLFPADEEPNVKEECARAAEAEYTQLVSLLQKRNIPITDELRQLAQEILRE
jgi:hypothetical protein